MTERKGLDYAYDAPPEPGTLIEVAPGLHWLRMPIPLDLDHINLWLIEDEDATGAPTWTLIDSGFGDRATKDLWRALFDGPAAGRRPHRLICTHYHPDHFGLAGWLARTYGVTVEMTETEWIVGSLLPRLDDATFTAGQDAFFVRNGLEAGVRGRLRAEGNEYRKRVADPPAAFTRIRDGETLRLGGRDWRVIVTEGHAAEHACLHCPELAVLICGDQLLPKITPNISVYWFKDGTRPLGEYLASLGKLEGLSAETLVLPSHRLPYRGPGVRVEQLRAHHAERLEALATGMRVGEALTAAALMPSLFPRALSDMHIMFALGETVAHLEHLVAEGRAVREIGPDAERRYRLAA